MKELIDALAAEYHSLALKLYLQFILIINEFDTEKTVKIFTFFLNKITKIISYHFSLKLDEFTYEIGS